MFTYKYTTFCLKEMHLWNKSFCIFLQNVFVFVENEMPLGLKVSKWNLRKYTFIFCHFESWLNCFHEAIEFTRVILILLEKNLATFYKSKCYKIEVEYKRNSLRKWPKCMSVLLLRRCYFEAFRVQRSVNW